MEYNIFVYFLACNGLLNDDVGVGVGHSDSGHTAGSWFHDGSFRRRNVWGDTAKRLLSESIPSIGKSQANKCATYRYRGPRRSRRSRRSCRSRPITTKNGVNSTLPSVPGTPCQVEVALFLLVCWLGGDVL